MTGVATNNLTLFTTCKPFNGEAEQAQKNALFSWAALGIPVMIIGDDAGAEGAAQQHGFEFVPTVDRNERGTPLVGSVFKQARVHAGTAYLAYVNADIILPGQLLNVLEVIATEQPPSERLLLTARRRNLPLSQDLAALTDWKAGLAALDTKFGSWDQANAIDMFLYNRDLFDEVPDFAIGRMSWDNWLLWRAHSLGARIIDASPMMALTHPIHGYTSHAEGWHQVAYGGEAEANRALSGGVGYNLDQATTHMMASSGKITKLDAQSQRELQEHCRPDPRKELLAGLRYLLDGKDTLSLTEAPDVIRTLLWRNHRYFPINAGEPSSESKLKAVLHIADRKGGDGDFSGALDALQDLLCDSLSSQLSDRNGPIYVWGAGQAGMRALRFLQRRDIAVRAVIDSDTSKCGGAIENTLIVPPDELEGVPKGTTILVASIYAPEITHQLKRDFPDIDAQVLS